MKIVYIAHPIGGDVQANLKDLRRIVKLINETFDDVVPFIPYYADVVSMDDSVSDHRNRGIKNDMAIFEKRCMDEVWLCGDRVSTGMMAEMMKATELGIPVAYKINQF